jgi:transcriptional regulator with XRE-family HTH domain
VHCLLWQNTFRKDLITLSGQESLDQYVRRVIKEKGLSLSDVERRSGGTISDSYVCGIINGNVGSLTIAKLKALAQGLGVPEDEVFAVARGRSPKDNQDFLESTFASLYSKYKDLSEDDKKEVFKLLEVIDREIEWRRTGTKSRTVHARSASDTGSKISSLFEVREVS